MAEQGMVPLPFQQAFEHFLIHPVTSWERFFNPQFFISYNRPDVGVENYVLSQVGSYGKQLGRLIDVLDVLVARVPTEDLTPRERRVLDQFRDLSGRVKECVAHFRGPRDEGITLGDMERVIDGLASLARSNPAAYDRIVGRLRSTIAEADGSQGRA
jgi:hypothetical protein